MGVERSGAHGADLPEGTLCFFRSDVEGSMQLSRSLGARYDELNAMHHDLVRGALGDHGGTVVRTEGDGVFAVFTDAAAAARSALALQRSMATGPWDEGHPFRVRVGLHVGGARRAGDDYGGFEVARAARIAALGWGGQTIVSEAARGLLAAGGAAEWLLTDLGRHRLKGVVEPERIYQLDASAPAATFPPLRAGRSATDHLPPRMTSLLGRETVLEELSGLLAEARLLTLTGPGGVGKTTLAVELARRHASEHADGAWFVALEGIGDAADVRSEVAHALGLLDGVTGSAADRLTAYVAERDLLIVIDNFEQVIDATELLAELLVASPRSRLIVTSRIALRIGAEQEYPLPPLQLGSTGEEPSEAERLFIERAHRARPGLGLDDELPAVRDICARLDGLPLAIELAAARVAALPVRAVRDRLARQLPLPGSGPRDLPTRQRTLEATIGWSHDLLDGPLKRLYARLGAFVDTFELEQAETVCGPGDELGVDVLDGLAALVDRSLVQRVDDPIGGIRFGMLQTIHDHAASLLEASSEAAAVRERHLAAYAALVGDTWPTVAPSDLARLADRIEPDDANVRAAVAHAITIGDTQTACRMVGVLWRPWLAIGRLAAGRELIAGALTGPGAEARTRARVMALDAAGGAAYWSGDLATAMGHYVEQLEIAAEIDDPAAIGMAYLNLYFCRTFSGDAEGAEAALASAERIAAELRLPSGTAVVEIARSAPLAMAAIADPAAQRPRLEEVIARFGSRDDPIYQPVTLSLRAVLSYLDADLSAAARQLAASVRACLLQRTPADGALYLHAFTNAARPIELPEVLAIMSGAASAAFERLGIAPPMDLAAVGLKDPRPVLVEALGEDGYRAATERGRRMSLAEATDYLEAISERLPGSAG